MARNRIGATLKSAMAGSLEEEEARIAAERTSSATFSNPAVELAKEAIRTEDRHATRMIAPNQVRMSAISDRIDPEEGLESLISSIRTEGQKVPILVRRLPDGELEVVYGRRRLLACRVIGCDVRATVMELDDEQALVAQGVENNERLNTSFIERALFAHRIEQAGFSPGVIRKVMGVDESLVRKMRSIAAVIPEPLISRIGSAPDSGRRPWEELKALCQELGETGALALAEQVDTSLRSSDRLTRILSIARKSAAAPKVTAEPDLIEGHVSAKRARSTLTFRAQTKADRDFLGFLEERAVALYQEWKGK